ncbi:MAG: accessory gene regulator ArgB-like protein [Bacillota bacterium]
MNMYDIANRMAVHLASETGMDKARVDRVRFGLEILLGEIIKLAILLAGAVLLGVLPETLAAMGGFSLFRLVSGGPHCEDYWRCLVFSLLVFLGSAAIGVLVAPFVTEQIMAKSIISGLFVMAVMVLIWAPGEVPQKKIMPRKRSMFKGLSLVFLALWAWVLAIYVAPYSIAAAVAGLLGTAGQALSFTPPGYRAMDGFDIALSRIIGERRCPTHAESA